MKKANSKTTPRASDGRGAGMAPGGPTAARKGRKAQGQREEAARALQGPLGASTGTCRKPAAVPDFFLPGWPPKDELEQAHTASREQLHEEAARLVAESASFLIALELAERVRRRLEGCTGEAWLYVDLDDEGDDVAGWLEAAAERLPGEQPREVVRGLWDVLVESFEDGADRSALLRRVAVLQRGAVAGLAQWRNVLGVVSGIIIAKGWEVPDEKTEQKKVLAEVRSLKRMVARVYGNAYRTYTAEDFMAMERKLKTLTEEGAAREILKERFGVEDPSSKEAKALVKAFQRRKKAQTAKSDKL